MEPKMRASLRTCRQSVRMMEHCAPPVSRQENAPGDAPYWRGPVWININFLALRALRFYADHAKAPPDVAETAAGLYERLRRNILGAVLGEWDRTGSLWEQYDDVSGRGMRSHPFTGWTALILNIMAEDYAL